MSTPIFSALATRPLQASDYDQWLPLWHSYNAFYGRSGPTALDPAITAKTWERFFNPQEPMFALVAQNGEDIVGMTHYLFHLSTSRIAPVCYLQDLYTDPTLRQRGIGRALIQAVYQAAQQAGSSRVYWQTQSHNATARRLYDQVAKHHDFLVYSHEL